MRRPGGMIYWPGNLHNVFGAQRSISWFAKCWVLGCERLGYLWGALRGLLQMRRACCVSGPVVFWAWVLRLWDVEDGGSKGASLAEFRLLELLCGLLVWLLR